jgi:hypothetical protein
MNGIDLRTAHQLPAFFSRLAYLETCGIISLLSAGVVQLVEHLLAKEKVMGSSPIARSFSCEVKPYDLVV